MSVGLRSSAEQLLDQLQALQRADGSLEFAFDTSTGNAAPYYRSGALAWVGLAAAAYKRQYDSDRYDALIGGTIKYLLSLRRTDGLIRGGPDVTWVSTQHNLLAVGFLRDIADQMSSKETLGGYTRSQLVTIHTTLSSAIITKLLVVDSSTLAHFKQGLDDAQIPLDVQSLGAMFLKQRGDSKATSVANTIQAQFPLSARKVAGGTASISGYKPFVGTGAPDVISSEGTVQAAVALNRVGISSSTASAAVSSIASTASRLHGRPGRRRSRRGQPGVGRVPRVADLGGGELAPDRVRRRRPAAEPLVRLDEVADAAGEARHVRLGRREARHPPHEVLGRVPLPEERPLLQRRRSSPPAGARTPSWPRAGARTADAGRCPATAAASRAAMALAWRAFRATGRRPAAPSNWAATKRIFDGSWPACLRTNRARAARARGGGRRRPRRTCPVLGAAEGEHVDARVRRHLAQSSSRGSRPRWRAARRRRAARGRARARARRARRSRRRRRPCRAR